VKVPLVLKISGDWAAACDRSNAVIARKKTERRALRK